MKRLIGLFLLTLFFFSNCERMEADFINDPDVEVFVKQIKNGTYNIKDDYGQLMMPNFYYEHIPELLAYVEDMTTVANYPNSTYSSTRGDLRLGVCVLWTIEGIRLGKKHASLNRTLLYCENEYEVKEVTNEEVLEIAKLYKKWWEGLYPFNRMHDKYLINPLEGTHYEWH